MSIYDKLQKLGITLPSPPAKGGIFSMVKEKDGYIYLSGQGPVINGEITWQGKVGEDRSVSEGQKAGCDCILNILAILHEYLGSLDEITDIVKILGLVQSAPDFFGQPEVMNGPSQMLLDIFGEDKLPCRSAIGVTALPNNITVEIESVFYIR